MGKMGVALFQHAHLMAEPPGGWDWASSLWLFQVGVALLELPSPGGKCVFPTPGGGGGFRDSSGSGLGLTSLLNSLCRPGRELCLLTASLHWAGVGSLRTGAPRAVQGGARGLVHGGSQGTLFPHFTHVKISVHGEISKGICTSLIPG